MKEKRFQLTEEYEGNYTVPIIDTEYSYDNDLFITEVVYKLNCLHEENKLNKKIIYYLIEYMKRVE